MFMGKIVRAKSVSNLHGKVNSGRAGIAPLVAIVFSGVLAGCGGGGGSGLDASGQQGNFLADKAAVVGAESAAPANGTNATVTPAATEGTSTSTTAPTTTVPVVLLTDALFAPTSFWYTAIPADAPLHANSAGFVADFLRQKQAYYQTVNINTKAYASPVYVADANAPTTKVAYWNCQKKSWPETALEAQWAAVPMPAYAQAADGSDAEMTVYQPSTDTLWEFWVARQANGQWQACWGGKMEHVSAGDGTWNAPYGTTATGLPFMGGQITAEELARGEIRHAIGISLVETEAFGVVSWPAKRSDGWNPDGAPNRIPQGLRFRLDPSIDVDGLSMTRAGKIVAKAAQKYGFVVWDKAGAISIRAQNPKSYTALGQIDPYPTLFSGKPSYAVLNGFPWERLQFMPLDYGKPPAI
jgi:hypothetical protein